MKEKYANMELRRSKPLMIMNDWFSLALCASDSDSDSDSNADASENQTLSETATLQLNKPWVRKIIIYYTPSCKKVVI